MHIPDGFLDPKTIVATSAFSILGITRALRNVRRRLHARMIPLMGLTAAFVFVAQILNFPVAGGTSGHLIGAVLVTVLLGPSAGILIMTVVLVVQCLLFADGGVLALGANVFNMAVIAPVAGFYTYRAMCYLIPKDYGKLIAIAMASWVSTVLAAVCCTGELAWSGAVPWPIGFPAMTGIHMVIGVGEALITTLICAAIYSARPELLHPEKSFDNEKHRTLATADFFVYGFIVTIGLALFVTPFASSWPDGLERVAAVFGFSSKALPPLVPSPIAQYKLPGVGSLSAATALAGIIGLVAVFLLSFFLARFLLPKSSNDVS